MIIPAAGESSLINDVAGIALCVLNFADHCVTAAIATIYNLSN
jgi:hypothetical protein